jgi:hypothetical protein
MKAQQYGSTTYLKIAIVAVAIVVVLIIVLHSGLAKALLVILVAYPTGLSIHWATRKLTIASDYIELKYIGRKPYRIDKVDVKQVDYKRVVGANARNPLEDLAVGGRSLPIHFNVFQLSTKGKGTLSIDKYGWGRQRQQLFTQLDNWITEAKATRTAEAVSALKLAK